MDFATIEENCRDTYLAEPGLKIPQHWRRLAFELAARGSVVDIGLVSGPETEASASDHRAAALKAMHLFGKQIDCYFEAVAAHTQTPRETYWSMTVDTSLLSGESESPQ